MSEERRPPVQAAAASPDATVATAPIEDEGEDIIVEEDGSDDEKPKTRPRRPRNKLSLRIPDDEIARPGSASAPDEEEVKAPAPPLADDHARTQEMPAVIIPIAAAPIIQVGPSDLPPSPDRTAELAPIPPPPTMVDVASLERSAQSAPGDGLTPLMPTVVEKAPESEPPESFDVPVDEDLGPSTDFVDEAALTNPRPIEARRSSIPPPPPAFAISDVTVVKAPSNPPPARLPDIPKAPAAPKDLLALAKTEEAPVSVEPLEMDEVEAAAVLSSRPPARASFPPPKKPSVPPPKLPSIPPTPIPTDAMVSSPRAMQSALVDTEEAGPLGDEVDKAEEDLAAEDVLAVESVRGAKPPLPAHRATSNPPRSTAPTMPEVRGAGAAPGPKLPPQKPPLVVVPPQGTSVEAAAAARRKGRPWWEELFNDDFIRTMAKITDAQIAAEVDFIEDSLGVAKGGAMLDLACGTGRHAIELSRRGYGVVGYDLSLAMLARAADEAQDRDQKLNFVQGDMRDMVFEDTFDGIFSWCTSFGYFDEEKNTQVVTKVHRALRQGGQFLLDVANRDYIIRQAPSLAWYEGEGCVCMDEMQVDWITSRMRVKRTMMMDDGRTKELEYSIRLYALHELGKLLHDCGFRVCEVSGRSTTPGVFFGPESPRTIILAEKR